MKDGALDKGLTSFDVAVVGGGPAGLSAAIASALAGARTALVARRTPYADNRTTALLGASVDFLKGLDVWSHCESEAAALKAMRLVDDTGRLIRAPEVRFSSEEIGLEAFGYNIENRTLVKPSKRERPSCPTCSGSTTRPRRLRRTMTRSRSGLPAGNHHPRAS